MKKELCDYCQGLLSPLTFSINAPSLSDDSGLRFCSITCADAFKSVGGPLPYYDTPSDPVNRPDHYTDGGIETIDFIKAKLTEDEFRGWIRGNCLKYLSRAGKKNGQDIGQDFKKAEWLLHFYRTGKKEI